MNAAMIDSLTSCAESPGRTDRHRGVGLGDIIGIRPGEAERGSGEERQQREAKKDFRITSPRVWGVLSHAPRGGIRQG